MNLYRSTYVNMHESHLLTLKGQIRTAVDRFTDLQQVGTSAERKHNIIVKYDNIG